MKPVPPATPVLPATPGLDGIPTANAWTKLAAHWQKDLKLWLLALVFLGVFRWLMIFLFRAQMSPHSGWAEIGACVLRGVRFDVSIASYWVLPCLLASVGGALRWSEGAVDRFRRGVTTLFVGLSTITCGVTIPFYREFDDQFNHWVLRGLFDDFGAIASTIWKEHPIVPFTLVAVLAVGLLWLGARRVVRNPFLPPAATAAWLARGWVRGLLVLVLPALLVVGLRGSAGRRPVQMKDASPTKDAFLNKMIPNPYSALRYAVRNYLVVTRAAGLQQFWPSGDIRAAARVAFPDATIRTNIDDCLRRTARGHPGVKPRHIFIVVMESHDAWPMLDKYRSLRLAEGLRELAAGGLSIQPCVSASDGTMSSLSTFISGLPDIGIQLNYQDAGRRPFPTSTPGIFQRLGYRTRMFRAGYLSWHRFGGFSQDQGFDEVHGGGDMHQGGDAREWGVDDDRLFQYALEHIPDDTPSFNVLLSRTYHPPYGLDVHGQGYPVRNIPADLAAEYNGKTSLHVFGHLWFADRELKRFMEKAEARYTQSVFTITGDHWSRRSVGDRPTIYERKSVAMVWRGHSVLAGVTPPPRLAAAHVDIVPTLVELAAPAGFAYHTFGRNLFDAAQPQVSFGRDAVAGPGFMFEMKLPDQVCRLPDMTVEERPELARPLAEKNRAYQAITWWRIVKGPSLPQ